MTSLYHQSVPVLIKYLHALSGLLQKAEKFAEEKGKTHDEILEFRLIEDMRGYVNESSFLGTEGPLRIPDSRIRYNPVQTQQNFWQCE